VDRKRRCGRARQKRNEGVQVQNVQIGVGCAGDIRAKCDRIRQESRLHGHYHILDSEAGVIAPNHDGQVR